MLFSSVITKMAKAPLTPGTSTPRSGQYQIIGPRGGQGPERTSIQGHPLPPTPKPGSTYVLVDPTRTK
jgi:hypothetical protein